MGCLSSKEARDSGGAGVAAVANDPVDFGVGGMYEVKKLLGEGGSGQTWLCIDIATRNEVAIKFIKRPVPSIVLPMLMHEIKIQANLGEGHINLVSAKAVVLTDSYLGIVMEYASGGNLTAYVTERWDTSEERNGLFLTEDEARYFFKQYIGAVEYLHANHVAHRDLKLDNIVLDGSTPPRIKVCDFGFAKNWLHEANMHTQIGTPVYMSPELITSKTNKAGYDATKADIWACGVLLFVMLLGMFPYDHTEHPDPNSSAAHVEVWMQQMKCCWRECPSIGDSASKLSPSCQDLLDKMFERDEKKRITIKQIKKHRWYTKSLPLRFQQAAEQMEQEQAEIDAHVQAGVYNSEKRDETLEGLLQLAGLDARKVPDSVTPSRLGLTKRGSMSKSGQLSFAGDKGIAAVGSEVVSEVPAVIVE